MKTLMVVLFSAACALAQPTDGPQVPQLLAAHGIKSAAEFLRVQRTWQFVFDIRTAKRKINE